MSYSSSLSFDSVVVIESLPSGDLKSGTDLFEQCMAPAALADPTLVVEIYNPSNRQEFFGAIEGVTQLARQNGSSPILHLETHGSRTGLSLADGSRANWDDLAEPFKELNRATRMNLLVFAGLCHGWSMIDILGPTHRAPVFGMIGPMEEIPARDLFSATRAFYDRLLQPDHDLRAALDAANGTSTLDEWRFKWVSAELMFCRVFEGYVEEVSRQEVHQERLNRLVADIARVRRLDVRQTTLLRSEVAADLDDHETWFRRYREHFLWLDSFPENLPRFPLTFRHCVEVVK